jgi:hypothetical protein
MSRLRVMILVPALAALLCATAAPLRAQAMGSSGGYDLDRLWERAQKQFDLSQQDAVVLLESRHVSVMGGGEIRTQIHRVVWIGTAMGAHGYADLRIPWNSATSTLTVSALRTWRDHEWWPDDKEISPSAVVETLPYAVALADDYTTMRETMLLHDGVGLPCVLETAYEIEERGVAPDGADGSWVFPQDDPAVFVVYEVTVPARATLSFRGGNGAPEPLVEQDARDTQTYRWTMENLEALGRPLVADPAAYEPYVSWSTWADWAALGAKVASSFEGACAVEGMPADTLFARIEYAPSAAAKARAVATLVNEGTRSIHVDSDYWRFSPRAATRTWETAYGHGLDRAVLAAALFRLAGLDAQPFYRSAGPSGVDPDVPGLSRLRDVEVWVQGDHFRGLYDPADGTLSNRPHDLSGVATWMPAEGGAPRQEPGEDGKAPESRFDLLLTLEPSEDGGWHGTGYWSADGLFSPYEDMAGLHEEALSTIGKVAASVLPEASVGGYNPETFEWNRVAVGFDVSVPAEKPDAYGRTGLSMGKPSGGIAALLPHDVHLYNERRDSPVALPGTMTQRVRLRVKTNDREVVHLPRAFEVKNETGSYASSSGKSGGWVVIEQTLHLNGGTVAPAEWPDLRDLLLEQSDAGKREILVK